jgi:dihydroxyacetone kinase-like protein
MAAELDITVLRGALAKVADRMVACRDALNEADAALGDGDIGVAVSEGFLAIKAELEGLPEDLGMALMKCAQALTRVRASSYATLVATGMMAGAAVLKGETAIDWGVVPRALGAAVAKMAARGRSELGEKTVLDSLEAVRAATEAATATPEAMRAAAREAVRAVMDEYRDRPCRQGRARIFADKSRGLDDPGMLALRYMVEAL